MRFCVVGEYGVSRGAKIATRMSAPTMTIPATSEPLRYQGRSERERAGPRAGLTGARVGAGAGVVVIGLPPCGEVDPRVKQCVHDVGEDADDDHEQRDEQRDALDGREVAGEDRVDHERSEPGNREHVLDDQRPADQVAEVDADDRDSRYRRVAQHVDAEERGAGHALGAGRADVFRAEDRMVDARRLRMMRRAHRDGQGERRQEQVVQVVRRGLPVAADREDPHPDREEQDQHDADPELRHALPEQACRRAPPRSRAPPGWWRPSRPAGR